MDTNLPRISHRLHLLLLSHKTIMVGGHAYFIQDHQGQGHPKNTKHFSPAYFYHRHPYYPSSRDPEQILGRYPNS